MSQVTEQSVRFQTALASIKLIQASAVLDLTEDDFDFLTSNKVWIATDPMPPNLGGFFMVRSYYPSECHADYFDFERIEALKPAIEACGISTLSQSPMLGFHKQMDNRIKLLEEILSFR